MSECADSNVKVAKKAKSSMQLKNQDSKWDYLSNLAMDLAEKKLKDGSASSQIITMLLGLASTKAQLELEKLRADVHLTEAKEQQIKDMQSSGELMKEAIAAFKKYSGHGDDPD